MILFDIRAFLRFHSEIVKVHGRKYEIVRYVIQNAQKKLNERIFIKTS